MRSRRIRFLLVLRMEFEAAGSKKAPYGESDMAYGIRTIPQSVSLTAPSSEGAEARWNSRGVEGTAPYGGIRGALNGIDFFLPLR